MLTIKEIYSFDDFNENLTKAQFIDFLYVHLDRFGDPKPAIEKSIDYALDNKPGQGGFLLAAFDEGELVGGLVMNKTGMSEYIPENILVYVAVDASKRGKGIGRQVIERSFKVADGDIKLHVEYDNPAKRLYERVGMVSKYAEMRYTKKK